MTAMGTKRKSSWVSETAATAPKQSFMILKLLATFGTLRTYNFSVKPRKSREL
jgi:hypothetical protein